MRFSLIAFSIYLTSTFACFDAVRAGPTVVMSPGMYTGRASAPLPDWTKKNARQTVKKQRKKNAKKQTPQPQAKPATTDPPPNKQTQ